jgi:hypothetical protein
MALPLQPMNDASPTLAPLPAPPRDPALIAHALELEAAAAAHRVALHGTDQWCWSWECRYRAATHGVVFLGLPGVVYPLCLACHTAATESGRVGESWTLRTGPPDPQMALGL